MTTTGPRQSNPPVLLAVYEAVAVAVVVAEAVPVALLVDVTCTDHSVLCLCVANVCSIQVSASVLATRPGVVSVAHRRD